MANGSRRADEFSRDPAARKFIVWIEFFRTIRRVTPYIAYFGIAYCLYLSIDAIAGTTTSLNFIHTISLKLLDRSLPWWALTICFVLWALWERSLRRRKTQTLTTRIQELETRLDPNRTSSGLLDTGDTHPDDKGSGV